MDLRRTALTTATHLGAVVAGAVCWWGVKASESQAETSKQQGAGAVPVAASASPEAMIASRLEKIIAEEKQSQDNITKKTVRQAALESIAKGKEELREHLETLQRWRAMADGFRATKDLSVPLQEALVEDDEDLAAAIFLEWHRRDPAEALYQAGIRPAWVYTVFANPPLMHAIPIHELTTFLATPHCPPEHRETIVRSISAHLGSMDDLAGLQAAYDAFDKDNKDSLVGFFMKDWVPDDGPAAAAFITGKMSPALRREFIEFLVSGARNPHAALTDDFAKALLARPLGELEALRTEIEEDWSRIDNTLGDSFYFRRDDAWDRLESSNGEQLTGNAASSAVGNWLNHNCDYPELLAAGEMDMDAIRAAVLKELPAAENYPEAFDEALFRKLFAHAPETAVSWAKDRIGKDEMADACIEAFDYVNEQRGARFQVLLAALGGVSDFGPGPRAQYLSEVRESMEETVSDWSGGWKNGNDEAGGTAVEGEEEKP